MTTDNFNIIGKKYNQTSVSDADREIRSLGLTDNAGNRVSALSIYPRVGISLSASETDEKILFVFNNCFNSPEPRVFGEVI